MRAATGLAHALPCDVADEVLASLPPSRFAFAYGSAIFPQHGVRRPERRMVDLIVAVDDAEAWHAQNMARNATHYTLPMRLLGPAAAARTQRSAFGARVYYNTILPSASSARSFKYGVVATADLEHDLRHWDSLYVSGRMHKPIRVLSPAPPRGLADAMDTNLQSATAAALLTLPERFPEHDLYHAAAALSYTGDVRMSLAAEVRAKVPNIVRANLDRFRALYRSPLSVAGAQPAAGGLWCREVEARAQARLLRRLPSHIRQSVSRSLGLSRDTGADALAALDRAMVGKAVVAAVATVVTRSSIRQSLKGIATAGIGTSARYVAAKLGKSLKARVLSRSKKGVAQIS